MSVSLLTGAAVLGAVAFLRKGSGTASSSAPQELERVPVLHRERAEGVRPELAAVLDAWAQEGTHAVVVAPFGGRRSSNDDQQQLAALGMSAATDLRSTPHGRGAALDIWPEGFLEHVPMSWGGTAARWSSWSELPQELRDQFAVFGEWAEARGLVWGGRWRSSTYPNGDQPHIELPNWRSLPFP